ncbi:MAG TPA: hypothetical protein VMB18_06940 [Terriglobales bacterium]|nr:hypothetical protein [Terriglobales bacterium]
MGLPKTGDNVFVVNAMLQDNGNLRERLERLGLAKENQLKLYGEQFELQSGPIIMGEGLVFVDAIEKRSGRLRRVRVPLVFLNMAGGLGRAA